MEADDTQGLRGCLAAVLAVVAALLAPAVLAGGAALIAGGDGSYHPVAVWRSGAWIASGCAGLAVYLWLAPRRRGLAVCLLIGATVAAGISWFAAELPYD